MSYEEEDTCHVPYEEEDTCHVPYEEEDTHLQLITGAVDGHSSRKVVDARENEAHWSPVKPSPAHEEEDTCICHVSNEEEDTCFI
jgi:hypothetical protein